MAWAIWVAVGIIALAGEAMTMSLILGSFALAALLLVPLSLALPAELQVPLFGALSLIILFAVRPAVLRILPVVGTEEPHSPAGPIGRDAIVVDRVDRQGGQIRIGRGEFWSARCVERGSVIEPGQEVQVVRMEGFTALVQPLAAPVSSRAEPSHPPTHGPASSDSQDASNPVDAYAEVRTFLFADIRGYTRFTQERGDEMAARLVERFLAVVREGVVARGGAVIEVRGDEALAVFALPRQAIRAAVDLQARFAQATADHPELPLEVGIGLDAGEVVRVEGGYRGGALNLAARLCGVAGPGQILISEDLAHLARTVEGLRYVDRGRAQLKGLPEPVHVVQVVVHTELGG